MKHREDELLPIEFLKKEVQGKYRDALSVTGESLTELELHFTSGDAELVAGEIRALFLTRYDLEKDTNVISLDIERAEQAKKESAKEEKSEAQNATENEPQNEQPAVDPAKECAERINALIGGEEFKALAQELQQIAPQIIQNKTYDIFSYQSYIFSINDGYGLSTYLSLLSNLFATLGIKGIEAPCNVIEEKLSAPKGGDGADAFSDVERVLRHGKKDEIQLLCIDISEWMNATNTQAFKEFLIKVERHMSEFIVVFRVPFVDKEVLERVRASLNDLVFVKTVSFPPFAQNEIQQCASDEMGKYGFSVADDAWDAFHARVAEEKGDGKFYGLNTIKKVVRELLYKKQLDNARQGKNELCITKQDTLALCAHKRTVGLSGYEMLDKLVGSTALKQRICEIISQIELAQKSADLQPPCIHMRFVGNPGTGKTTVARIVGKILKEKGVLRIGNFYEYAGRDFCGRYIGETAPKTASMCRDAYGSVLFIDEAYSLYRGDGNDRDYGREALDTLIAEMENHRSDLVVIMAGYTEDMERLMQGNAGLASRMPYVIEFPNFTREQLYDIFVSMVSEQFEYEVDMLGAAKAYFNDLPQNVIEAKEFSNARFVRNLFERTWAKAAMRSQLEKAEKIILKKDDFERSTCDKEFTFVMKKKPRIGFSG